MTYEFKCLNEKCSNEFEAFVKKYDETGVYPNVACPNCGSNKKEKLLSCFSFNFKNPIGTDLWNADHDYRFKHNLPKVAEERAIAEKAATADRGFTSANPYNPIDDIKGGKFFGEVK